VVEDTGVNKEFVIVRQVGVGDPPREQPFDEGPSGGSDRAAEEAER
jgi:hypothetical protein